MNVATTRRRPLRSSPNAALLLLALPALLFFLTFAVAPLFGVLWLSFMRWDGLGAITPAGLENWGRVFSDPLTANALWLTVIVVVLSVCVQMPLSILLGTFIAGHQKYRAGLSVVYFIPLLLSSAAIAIAFLALLDPNFGVGSGLGLPWLQQNWFGDSNLALGVVVFVLAWQNIAFYSLIYQGGVRQIPVSLYEASNLDGAGRVQQFIHVTLPQLKYTMITSTTLMVVGSLTFFDLIFVLTGGGPGNATRVLPLQMYTTGFQVGDMGLASAYGVMLAVLGLVIALAIQRLGGRDRRASQLEGM